MPKKKTAAKKKAVTKKAAKKITKNKKVAKPKPGALKKTAKKKAATEKRKPIPKGTIPLKLSLGNTYFYGYLQPLPQIATWGGPESLDIFIDNQPGSATISSATGTWVILNAPQIPEHMKAEIILTIQKYYNGKGFNTPM